MAVTYPALKRGRGQPRTDAADYVRFLVRMPEDLLEFIKDSADAEYRSINSEIIKILTEWRTARQAHYDGLPAPKRAKG